VVIGFGGLAGSVTADLYWPSPFLFWPAISVFYASFVTFISTFRVT
jgi:hypothetical protein